MPYIPIKEKEPIVDNGNISIHAIKWEAQGQCVSMYPNAQFMVYKKGCAWSVTVEHRSGNEAKKLAISIGEFLT